ncbi:DUF1205 domain-containing protein [Solihabitans fulvus]|uniref:DUF1205 domain-containing protein n=1 Tax=Solihabitans fulvus TaxID=1892852 RepID=A0A5B2W486_9PSEU|nr:nucleotide disphospho-sugar-binding domain-containing protein [Solihabitans fulvus]KAA2246753.1 DUF1205 domain-containing protein [Solihabitans fulvus]
MRVLFAGVPAVGHLFPMVPLARALASHGHEVAVAAMDGGEVIRRAGLPYLAVAPGVAWRDEVRAAGARRPELMARVLASNSADREAVMPIAAQVSAAVADATVAVAAAWRPDLVVYEYQFPAALLAATALGVPAVQHDLGFVRTPRLRELMLAELADAFARHGVRAPHDDVPTIDIAPPSMTGGHRYGWSVRPVPYNGDDPLPAALAHPPDRPRVAVTLGTVAPRLDGLTRLGRVVAAAADLDAEFVLAMGDLDISSLGALPPNVHAHGWLPWDALLGTCAAAIHHGGCGTTFGALARGIPQLLLPDGSDRFISAAAVGERGAGLAATAEDIDAALLTRLLTDEDVAGAAREVRAEIAAMPHPSSLLPDLVALAR